VILAARDPNPSRHEYFRFRDVRFGSKADMTASQRDVRFTPNSGRSQCKSFMPIADIFSNEISRAKLCQDACDIAQAPMLDDTFALPSENIARGEAQ
jgi:hypothetical protein